MQLEESNRIDSLTKVYNKGYLHEKLVSESKLNEDIIFVMIDIDYFKLYNDNYGHIKGDEILINVATIIKNVFKDDLVFRYGGEEFSVISKNKHEDLIEDIKELQSEIYEANMIHEYSEVSDRISISIGIASANISSEQDMHDMVKLADDNLYKSKKNGRNRYTY